MKKKKLIKDVTLKEFKAFCEKRKVCGLCPFKGYCVNGNMDYEVEL